MSEPERVFLHIFSLFRTEVTENDFAGVFRHEIEDTQFNDVLVKMSELDFRDLINGLVDWRLISYDETKKTYITHPLIKGYFESDFDEKDKKLCHKRIYQYFGDYAPEQPETLEEMQPLFEQVYHGCGAGLFDEVWWDVYWEKICREEVYFITQKLGAEETNLSLVRTFFPKGDLSRKPLVSEERVQSWLLNEAGLTLENIGRPKEAEEPFLTALKMVIEAKNWENVSSGFICLADLQFRTGRLESGLESAQKALDAAEKAKSDEEILNSKAYFAWILHLLGKNEGADKKFKEADELNRLYSWIGIFYADFLLSMKRIDEAVERTKQKLEICQSQNWPNEISRCHRCLGAIEKRRKNYKEAKNHLQKALEIACKIGMSYLEIEVLLEFGRLHIDMERHEDAIRDAKEVLKICARTGFKLYEPEAEVVLSKTDLALNNIEQAKTFAHSAYEKAAAMNYRWSEGDAAHLLGEIYLKMGDNVKAREWLEKAVACRKEILDPEVKESERMLKSL
jgi:tetratricopeptide (TPR) repeat protein